MINSNPYDVRVGQIWVDNDPRHEYTRNLQVLVIYLDSREIPEHYQKRRGFWPPDAFALVREIYGGIPTRNPFFVKLHRFNGRNNGYKLLYN